jgi:hypothetical protein
MTLIRLIEPLSFHLSPILNLCVIRPAIALESPAEHQAAHCFRP